MKLVIGGRAQGKLAVVLEKIPEAFVADGADCTPQEAERVQVLNHLHLLLRRMMADGADQTELLRWAETMLFQNPEVVILCDEIGCGIVPWEKEERDWREAVGRVCCFLAQRAECVDRIVCGIPVRLKG